MIVKDILNREFSHLNDVQKQAVFTTEGPLLILAGAGSGKTTVLINRIENILNYGDAYNQETPQNAEVLEQYLETFDENLKNDVRFCLNTKRVKPWEILAITFTNKAAKELKERLEKAIGENAKYIWAKTFHATCTRILRENAEVLGYSSSFTIYDETDKKRIITDILKTNNLDEKKFDPRVIGSAISRAKDSLTSSASYKKEVAGDYFKETIAEIYSQYEKRLYQSNAMDFDDIIAKTVLLFDKNEDVLLKYQEKFRYIMVDEYQDTNHAQYKLVYMLAQKHKNICVVGDDDQSIYKFRGATITNILEFEKDYTNAKTIRLEQNYRSTSNILTCANGLISKNTLRKGKKLWTEDETDKKVRIHRVENQEAEARYIAGKILAGVGQGLNFSDYAILYRNHALANAIENALKRQAVPYQIFGGHRFFDRAEVRDIIAYMWVINNVTDDLRLKRIVNTPARKITAKTIDLVEYLAVEDGLSIFGVMETTENYADLQRVSSALGNFVNIVRSLQDDLKTNSLDAWYDLLLQKTGYEDMLKAKASDIEVQTRLENIYELKSSIVEYMVRAEDEEPSLSGFLEEISLFTELDRADDEQSAVTMLTIHSAKGLEFKNVFICGMEDGIFPSFRSLDDPAEIEEERRLAYVAVTRAKERLTLTCVESRLLYGQTKHYKPSIFITEIPEETTDSNISKGQIRVINNERQQNLQSKQTFSQNQNSISVKPKVQTISVSYDVGEQISHNSFGKGMIASVKPMAGGDLLLEIAFEEKGTKRLLAKSASQFITKL
ncbi:MAG: 3'-5' exonuclease [Clostridia bacterium]